MKGILFILVVVICSSVSSAENKEGVPTFEQVQKLVTAAWKEPINQIDITFYKEYMGVPDPVETIRKRVEESIDKEFKGRSLDQLKPHEIERRKKNIEGNLLIRIKEQNFPQKMKERVWISGNKQRTDFVKVGPDEPLDLATPFVHTFINTDKKCPSTGKQLSYHYSDEIKTVFVDTSKWQKKDIVQFANMPSITTLGLQSFLGIENENMKRPAYLPDSKKMEELSKTGIVKIESIRGEKLDKAGTNRISIFPDPNDPVTRDRIEIAIPDYFPMIVMICDREDYSRVYRFETHNIKTNQIISVRECSDFDLNGFPRRITDIQYDLDGEFKEKSVYQIIKVNFDSVPDTIFEYFPPMNYKIIDKSSRNSTQDLDPADVLKP